MNMSNEDRGSKENNNAFPLFPQEPGDAGM